MNADRPAHPMALSELPALLRDDPALAALAGGSARLVAVSEAPRAFFLAGLTRLTGRRPLVVGVPTTAEAEGLAHDLRQFLPEADGASGSADPIELFPAWETLPFERVSPATETMGRRLRVLWRLRCGIEDPSVLPQVIIAPVRALAQRLGPHVEDVAPTTVAPGQVVDRDELAARLVAAGYRREYQVEARGEFAVRGSILDVYPSTADHPVRIDLWGDEVDRLQSFSVADQRATGDVGGLHLPPQDRIVEIFPCRELLPTEAVRARAEKLIGAEPWGRAQWERLSEGLLFDGMESWLPWLTDDERLLPDLLPDDALVLLVEPGRMRDRVGELNDEEASLANSLASTWGLPEGHDMPRLTPPSDRPAPGPPPAPRGPAGRGLLRRPQGRRLRRPQPARRRPLLRDGGPHHGRRRTRLPAAGVQGGRQALHPVRPGGVDPALHRRRIAQPVEARRRRLGQDPGQGQEGRPGDRPGARRAVPAAEGHPGARLPVRHAVADGDGGGLPV